MIKIITVLPGEILSLQTHEKREEFWHIISGNGTAQVNYEVKPIGPGDEIFVYKATRHRVSGGSETLVFLELAFGDFDEGDIVRLEDKYGRVK